MVHEKYKTYGTSSQERNIIASLKQNYTLKKNSIKNYILLHFSVYAYVHMHVHSHT